jgi:hypothetical protein
MEKEIKLMEDLGMPEEGIREMKLRLLRLYQRLRQHTTDSLEVVDLCEEDEEVSLGFGMSAEV